MGEVILRKTLGRTEKAENWITVPKSVCDIIRSHPVLRVKGQKVPMHINDRRIWPETLLWDQFVRILGFNEEEDALLFIRHEDGTLEIACERAPDTFIERRDALSG